MSEEALASPAFDVEGVRARRASVRKACQRIQELLADVPADEAVPPEQLDSAVETLAAQWGQHVKVTESPDGILRQIVHDSPRMSTTASRLQGDHSVVTEHLQAAQRLLAGDPVALPEARRELDVAIEAIDRHRRGGNALIYDAYNLDIGLGE